MEQNQPPRTCPKCGSGRYQFNGRKKLPAVPEKGEPAATETRYKCKTCEHGWKVKVADAAAA
jgi:hypothetical protein